MYDSNFDLHLQLPYNKGNKEDITMTYTISRRGSVLRLTDSNLSVYIELLNYSTWQDFHNDFVWLSTVHYEQEFLLQNVPFHPFDRTLND